MILKMVGAALRQLVDEFDSGYKAMDRLRAKNRLLQQRLEKMNGIADHLHHENHELKEYIAEQHEAAQVQNFVEDNEELQGN
jgi:septation ring formation regulator EzrA